MLYDDTHMGTECSCHSCLSAVCDIRLHKTIKEVIRGVYSAPKIIPRVTSLLFPNTGAHTLRRIGKLISLKCPLKLIFVDTFTEWIEAFPTRKVVLSPSYNQDKGPTSGPTKHPDCSKAYRSSQLGSLISN